jgi:RNA polymerase sigma-70 factor (ECF subfamily)
MIIARKTVLIPLLCLSLTGMFPAEETVSVATLPPVVVNTVPAAGDTAVDPGLTEICVTFSKEMLTRQMWSWVMLSRETFPEITGEVRFLPGGRTCVAPVRLEPGKTYAIWLNSEKFNAFRDTGNRPAVPYLLVFETRE